MLLTMNRRTFLGWTGGLLAGLGGLFGAKRALGATPEPKAAPRASQGDFQCLRIADYLGSDPEREWIVSSV